MDKDEFMERLKKISPEGREEREKEMAIQKAAIKAKGKRTGWIVLTSILLVFGGFGFCFFYFGHGPRFTQLLYVTDATGKSSMWVHTRQYIRFTSKNGPTTYHWQKNSLHILDPVTSKEIKEIELPAVLFPYSRLWMIAHGKTIWIIKPYDSGERSDEPAPALFRLDPSNGAIVSKTDDFVKEHSELQAGIKNVSYNAASNDITLETKDGLTWYYKLSCDSLIKETGRFSELTPVTGTYFLLHSEGLGLNSDRLKLNGVHPAKEANKWMATRQIMDRGPDTRDTDYRMEPLQKDKVYLKARILAQNGKQALILHRSEVGDDGKVMLTCVDDTGKECWTLNAETTPILSALNRHNRESFFMGPGQISSNTSARIQDDAFIVSLDLIGAMALDLKTGTVKWIFSNPYDSRY
jgi:hypothetical protein